VIYVVQPKEISRMKTPTTPAENTQELRDAPFRAICLHDHARPENDTDHCDVAAARELSKLRETLNQAAYQKEND
jgi:hypothetical protein